MPLDLTYISNSNVHHRGLFAKKFIKKGTRVIEYTGEKITSKEADRREELNDKIGITYIFILNSRYCIDGAVDGNDSIYINHSCNPNLKVVIKNNHIYLYAIKNIKKDEELSYDYAFDYDPDNLVICHCASPNCRGFINEAPNS